MMHHYILRLDDASEHMNVEKWLRMEALLDEFGIKPIVGIIPCNEDPMLLKAFPEKYDLWTTVQAWIRKGWSPALHGCRHRYVTEDGGINPVHRRSEFAGLPLDEQRESIRRGYDVLTQHGVYPTIFFAPSHTFDENTLRALALETPIRVISDTVAGDVYKKGEFWFIPQQSGRARSLPFKVSTFCYHPNFMEDAEFAALRAFLEANASAFISADALRFSDRGLSFRDRILQKTYFLLRKLRSA